MSFVNILVRCPLNTEKTPFKLITHRADCRPAFTDVKPRDPVEHINTRPDQTLPDDDTICLLLLLLLLLLLFAAVTNLIPLVQLRSDCLILRPYLNMSQLYDTRHIG